jgi:biotin operon repressor
MLSENQIHLIMALLNANEPQSAQKLADDIHVSIRTVKSCVRQINDMPETPAVHSNTHKGYWIESEDKRTFMDAVYYNDSHSTFPSTRNRRVIYIGLHMLKYQNRTPSFQAIADEFYVAKTTIANDICFLKEIASAAGGITITTRKTGGLTISGTEAAIRHFFSSLIALFYQEESSYIKRCIMETFAASSTATPLHETLIRILAANDIHLVDQQMNLLTFQILFAAYRCQNSHVIDFPAIVHETYWVSEVEACLQVKFPEPEKNYIAFLIRNARHDDISRWQNDADDTRYLDAASAWLQRVKEQYGIDLKTSEGIHDYLSSILRSTVVIDRPMADPSILNHPFAQHLGEMLNEEILSRHLQPLDEYTMQGLTAELIIFLDQNIKKQNAVLLLDGPSHVRRYAAFRLNSLFSHYLNVIHAYPLYAINRSSLFEGCDLILSTSHKILEWSTYKEAIRQLKIPILFISPALSDSDILAISQEVRRGLPSCRMP